MKIIIPNNLPKYNLLYNTVNYKLDDIMILLPHILDKLIIKTNSINDEFDYIFKMEQKESDGYYLREYNTNLNYKVMELMNIINNIYDKLIYVIEFQLNFSNKFQAKMKKIASEINIIYH